MCIISRQTSIQYLQKIIAKPHQNRLKRMAGGCSTGRHRVSYNIPYKSVPCKINIITCVYNNTFVPMKSICHTIEKKRSIDVYVLRTTSRPRNPSRKPFSQMVYIQYVHTMHSGDLIKNNNAGDRISRGRALSPAVYYHRLYSRRYILSWHTRKKISSYIHYIGL